MFLAISLFALVVLPFTNACNQALTGTTGTFTSPGYPSNYPDSKNCLITITVATGKVINLQFTAFELEADSSCSYDYVEIKDGDKTKKYCGASIPAPYMSKGNVLEVTFKSDVVITKKGFSASFTAMDPPPPQPPATVNAPNCGITKVAQSRVIAGTNATKGAWPWQVGLHTTYGSFFCGGSLIAPNWVVTAAHCLEGFKASQLRVKAGDLDREVNEGTEQEREVEKTIIHSRYHVSGSECAYSQLNHDVGLIKLAAPVMLNDFVNTICLPSQSVAAPVNTKCYITGWGKIKHPGDAYRHLQQAVLPIVDTTICQTKVSQNIRGNIKITDQMVCAGTEGSKASGCQGDSGGPLACLNAATNKYVLHGDVSWGPGGCDTSVAFSVFGRMSEFRSWIDQKLKEN